MSGGWDNGRSDEERAMDRLRAEVRRLTAEVERLRQENVDDRGMHEAQLANVAHERDEARAEIARLNAELAKLRALKSAEVADIGAAILRAWPEEQKVTVGSIPPEVAAVHRTEREVDFAEIEAWLTRFEDIGTEGIADMDREDLETDLEVATASYVPALLDEVQGAENALLRAGIPDDGRPLAERIATLDARLAGTLQALDEERRGRPDPFIRDRDGYPIGTAEDETVDVLETAHAALDPIVARRDTADGPLLSMSARAATAVRIAQEAIAARDAAIALFRNPDGTVGEHAEGICHLADILRGKPITVEHRCADPAKCPLCSACARGEHRRAGETMPGSCADCGVAWADLDNEGTVATEPLSEGALASIRSRHEATARDDMDTGDGMAAHDDREDLLGEVDRLRDVVTRANNALFDVLPEADDPEHVIECHKDTLPDTYRRLAAGVRATSDILAPTVLEMVEPSPFAGSDGAHAGTIAALAESRKENRQNALAGLTEEQRQRLTSLAADPAFRARFNGSTARVAVLNESVPLERRSAAGMREYLNGAFGLTITITDLATALGISEADMTAIEAGAKSTDAAGWTTIQTACFCLGSGTKPEHIADPTNSPAFQRAMEAEDEPVHYAAKGDPVVYPTACGLMWTQDARFQWTDNADDVRGCPTCESAAADDNDEDVNLADLEASFGAGARAWNTPEGQRFLREMRGGLNEHGIDREGKRLPRSEQIMDALRALPLSDEPPTEEEDAIFRQIEADVGEGEKTS